MMEEQDKRYRCPVCHGTGKVTVEEQWSFVDRIMGFVLREQSAFADRLRENVQKTIDTHKPKR